jgi:dimethylamine/trimethylamine dehydrogenase
MRLPDDALYRELSHRIDSGSGFQPKSLSRIGDCDAPAVIAGAVFSGHRYARELDADIDPDRRIKFDRLYFDDGRN